MGNWKKFSIMQLKERKIEIMEEKLRNMMFWMKGSNTHLVVLANEENQRRNQMSEDFQEETCILELNKQSKLCRMQIKVLNPT